MSLIPAESPSGSPICLMPSRKNVTSALMILLISDRFSGMTVLLHWTYKAKIEEIGKSNEFGRERETVEAMPRVQSRH